MFLPDVGVHKSPVVLLLLFLNCHSFLEKKYFRCFFGAFSKLWKIKYILILGWLLSKDKCLGYVAM